MKVILVVGLWLLGLVGLAFILTSLLLVFSSKFLLAFLLFGVGVFSYLISMIKLNREDKSK